MGPDEKEVKNFVMCPINPDGSFGEPIELEKLKTVEWDGLELGTDSPDNSMYKNSLKFLTKNSSEIVVIKSDLPRKISRKKFKKWLMSKGFDRDLAEWVCNVVKFFRGKYSYHYLYFYGWLAPGPQTLFNNLFDALFPIYKIKID